MLPVILRLALVSTLKLLVALVDSWDLESHDSNLQLQFYFRQLESLNPNVHWRQYLGQVRKADRTHPIGRAKRHVITLAKKPSTWLCKPKWSK